MWFVDFLARRIQRFAIPNLTLVVLIGQIFLYGIWLAGAMGQAGDLLDACYLYPSRVLNGEVWRLITFVFVPPVQNPIFFLFYCGLFYMMGTALENHWGVARYNLFLLIGYFANVVATLGVGLATGMDIAGHGAFVNGTVFLAFAYLYPSFVLRILGIFPVKVKWLALLEWVMYGFLLVAGPWTNRVLIVASVANFLLFFGGEIIGNLRAKRRSSKWRAKQMSVARIRHHCTVCGITSETHPEMDFRYCSKCVGNLPYCSEHLRNHVHVTEDWPQESDSRTPVSR